MAKKLLPLSLLIFFIIGSFFVPIAVFAAPTVSGVTINGQGVTVSGNSFGAKTQPAPVKWDNFESGALGSPISGYGWQFSPGGGGVLPVVSSAQPRGVQSKSSLHDFTAPAYNSRLCYRPPDTSDQFGGEFFVTYWIRIDNYSGNRTENWKPVKIRGRYDCETPSGGMPQAVSMRLHDEHPWPDSSLASTQNGVCSVNVNEGGDISQAGAWTWVDAKLGWTRMQYHVKLSTGSNGFSRISELFPGAVGSPGAYRSLINYTGQNVATGCNPANFGSVDLMEYLRTIPEQGGPGPNANSRVYLDEVYIDNTQARLELCNASTWALRTHCEIQIPTSWSQDGRSITATVNQGAFTNNQTVYAYVADANGATNSTGYPVTLSGGGGGPDTQAPAIPTNFAVQ